MLPTALNDSVMASIDQVNGTSAPTAFINEIGSEDEGKLILEKIMTQKYIAMFIQI